MLIEDTTSRTSSSIPEDFKFRLSQELRSKLRHSEYPEEAPTSGISISAYMGEKSKPFGFYFAREIFSNDVVKLIFSGDQSSNLFGRTKNYLIESLAESSEPNEFSKCKSSIFLASLYAQVACNKTRDAVKKILNHFNKLLAAEKFDEVDEILDKVQTNRLNLDTLLALVSITYLARLELRHRDNFFDSAYATLVDQVGAEKTERLFSRYR